MPEIIAVLNEKGGSGKTTLSTNLARAFQLDGRRVLLVDTDPQGSSMRWWDTQTETRHFELTALPCTQRSVTRWLQSNAAEYEVVVVDGEPGFGAKTRSWIEAADLVLMPIQPSVVDIWAVSNVVDVVQIEQKERGGPAAAFVLSRASGRTKLTAEVVEHLQEDYDIPLLDAWISNRVVYAEAIGFGSSVLDMDKGGKAALEIMAIHERVKSLLAKV